MHTTRQRNASMHTRLINMFVGLCTNTERWPSILFDLGYDVRLIEPTMGMQSANKINPDVIAVSEDLSHASGRLQEREQHKPGSG